MRLSYFANRLSISAKSLEFVKIGSAPGKTFKSDANIECVIVFDVREMIFDFEI